MSLSESKSCDERNKFCEAVFVPSEWTQAGFGFVINGYLRGGERRQRKPEGLKSEHKDCFGWVGYS